jgi:hypothetical protein
MSVTIPDQAYPLTWPITWPRFKGRRESARFSSTTTNRRSDGSAYNSKREKSMADACDLLYGELDRLGAKQTVVSTNVQVRLDGRPYANQPKVSDPGAAVYFVLKGKPIVLACDKWARVEDNVYAVAKHIESIRAQERWGVGRIEQAFAGYMALPAPMTLRPWWETLDVSENCTYEQARDSYTRMAKDFHPDVGGDGEIMADVNVAWENAKLARGWK